MSYACAFEPVGYPSCVGIPEGGVPKSTWLNVVCLYNLLGQTSMYLDLPAEFEFNAFCFFQVLKSHPWSERRGETSV